MCVSSSGMSQGLTQCRDTSVMVMLEDVSHTQKKRCIIFVWVETPALCQQEGGRQKPGLYEEVANCVAGSALKSQRDRCRLSSSLQRHFCNSNRAGSALVSPLTRRCALPRQKAGLNQGVAHGHPPTEEVHPKAPKNCDRGVLNQACQL